MKMKKQTTNVETAQETLDQPLKLFVCHRGVYGMGVCAAYDKEEAVKRFHAMNYSTDGSYITEHTFSHEFCELNTGDE